MKENGTVTRARLGVYYQELTPKLASALGVKASGGAVVTEIVPDGPASKSGLQKDDVIVALDGKIVDGRTLRPGGTVRARERGCHLQQHRGS